MTYVGRGLAMGKETGSDGTMRRCASNCGGKFRSALRERIGDIAALRGMGFPWRWISAHLGGLSPVLDGRSVSHWRSEWMLARKAGLTQGVSASESASALVARVADGVLGGTAPSTVSETASMPEPPTAPPPPVEAPTATVSKPPVAPAKLAWVGYEKTLAGWEFPGGFTVPNELPPSPSPSAPEAERRAWHLLSAYWKNLTGKDVMMGELVAAGIPAELINYAFKGRVLAAGPESFHKRCARMVFAKNLSPEELGFFLGMPSNRVFAGLRESGRAATYEEAEALVVARKY